MSSQEHESSADPEIKEHIVEELKRVVSTMLDEALPEPSDQQGGRGWAMNDDNTISRQAPPRG